MAVEVILDIYSGRENPRWRIAPPEILKLQQKLNGIWKKKTNHLPDPPGLGYRGFHLSATEENMPKHMTVFESVVQTESGNFQDPDRGIEKWLIQQSKGHADKATYDYLVSLAEAK